MENYNDQTHTVHVELDIDKDSTAITVAFTPLAPMQLS